MVAGVGAVRAVLAREEDVNMLIRLHNGQWIDPAIITAIVTLDRTQCGPEGAVHPSRIVIHAGAATTILNCDDLAQAQTIADDLAESINNARNQLSPQ